ncbi:alpha-amylase family glycosyl hydrolase [Ileibacterium valens]|uniref:alpha-amylase family glycosyl hydrolase n=1 Tax=Ileibacterium valens TaxID=1862668 RepID=UPI003398BF08
MIAAAGDSLDSLYHQNSAYDMNNFSDRLQLTTYKMGGLPDVNTENSGFQEYFFNFLKDAIDAGADGFRFDTAKHIALEDDPVESKGMENNFWTNTMNFLKDRNIQFPMTKFCRAARIDWSIISMPSEPQPQAIMAKRSATQFC